jgi:F-type H+-transporting ATPase subunit epsilon
MESMKLELVTPEGVIYDGEIKTVTLPGSEGEFGVLKDHAGTVTTLKAGVIEIEKVDGSKELVAVDWGTVKVEESKVTILADGAVAISGGDVSASIAKAKELISSMSDSDIAIASATAKLESAAKGF